MTMSCPYALRLAKELLSCGNFGGTSKNLFVPIVENMYALPRE
jgi:hypothetical protein